MAGKLFLVATPIGNLADLSARALETLRSVSFIACEDTRHSRALLAAHGISKETVSLPAFAEVRRSAALLDRIAAGEDCALITDAGSPGISDPGEKLVASAIERGIQVSPIPGATALIAALSASGLPSGRFHFVGFVPRAGRQRSELLEDVEPLRATLIFYESPQRLSETLRSLQQALGNRRGCVARELTKVHEEFIRGSLGELSAHFETQKVLGEVVILVEGRRGVRRWTEEEVRTAIAARLSGGTPLKSLSTEIAQDSGWRARDVYRLGLNVRASFKS
jgi:16S rRNA (cytidine1402-2'-O)-methyltransferase